MPRSDSSKKTKVFVYTSPKTPIAMHPTLVQSVKEGFGLGIGVSIARNMVDRVFGLPSVKTTLINSREYTQCIQEGGNEEVCTAKYH